MSASQTKNKIVEHLKKIPSFAELYEKQGEEIASAILEVLQESEILTNGSQRTICKYAGKLDLLIAEVRKAQSADPDDWEFIVEAIGHYLDVKALNDLGQIFKPLYNRLQDSENFRKKVYGEE